LQEEKQGYSLELKEGNAGVFSKLGQLKDGASFTISIDTNATYREYLIGSSISHPLIITSDELIDFKVITVILKNGELNMEQTPRDPPKAPSKSYWSEFLKLFQKVIGQISKRR